MVFAPTLKNHVIKPLHGRKYIQLPCTAIVVQRLIWRPGVIVLHPIRNAA